MGKYDRIRYSQNEKYGRRIVIVKLVRRLLLSGAAAGLGMAKRKANKARKHAKRSARRVKFTVLFSLLMFAAGAAAGGCFVFSKKK